MSTFTKIRDAFTSWFSKSFKQAVVILTPIINTVVDELKDDLPIIAEAALKAALSAVRSQNGVFKLSDLKEIAYEAAKQAGLAKAKELGKADIDNIAMSIRAVAIKAQAQALK